MFLSLKTKIFNKSLFIFLFLAIFSFGFLALADEQEVVTTFLDDIDQDGLTADEEKAYGTDPTNNDTDGDSYSDGVEIESGYDPLLPAPGDRIVPENEETESAAATSETTEPETVNLTELATEELNTIVSEKQDAQEELTNEDLNQAVANVLAQSNQEVELPEVDVDKIKIKELEAKLSESEKENKRKDDVMEYLTVMGYIVMSNFPREIRSQSDLKSFALRSVESGMVSLASGNYSFLTDVQKRMQRIQKEIEGVEVPESMMSTHVRALKLAGFITIMIDKIYTINPVSDPIGQMDQLAKIQGGILEMQNFYDETASMLTQLGLSNMSVDFLKP